MLESIFLFGSTTDYDMVAATEWMDAWERLAWADYVMVPVQPATPGLSSGSLQPYLGHLVESDLPRLGPAGTVHTYVQDIADAIAPSQRMALELLDHDCWQELATVVQQQVHEGGGSYHQYLLCSERYSVLRDICAHDHHIKTALIVDHDPAFIPELAAEHNAYAVLVGCAHATQEFADRCHEGGLMVFARNAEDTPQFECARAMHADGVITHHPERFLRWRTPHACEAREFAFADHILL